MPVDTFTVVALPYRRDETAPFHVSLFVAPELTPDGAEGELSEFPRWLTWTEDLASASIRLFNQQGEIAATPRLDGLEPDVWAAMFPPDTPVRGRERPDWRNRHWRTFRAAGVHDTAKLLSAFALTTSPTQLPTPDPDTDLFTRLMIPFGVQSARVGADERKITRALDRRVGESSPRNDPTPLVAIEKAITDARGFEQVLLELHRARRFYERPERLAANAYERRPIDGARRDEIPRPEPDFHERLTLLTDHAAIERRLGIVIDLVVEDLAALSASQLLRAEIQPATGGASRSPETDVRVVGTHMVADAPDDSDWSLGRLRLGEEDRFRVLDMDADGGALKTERFMMSVPRLLEVHRSTADASTATPAQRTGGFTLVRHQRALATQGRLDEQETLAADLAAGSSRPLTADDVMQGLRVEVWDDTAKAWFSLHQRRVDADVVDHGTVVTDAADEGFVQGTTASETSDVEDSPVHVHEAVASWGGWSLSAPKPGRRVRHDNATGDEVVEETQTPPDPVTPIVITSRAEPGSLPRLRYGRHYAFRAWGVDLAGNSRPHALGATAAPGAPSLAEITTAITGLSAVSLSTTALLPTVRAEASAVVVGRREAAAARPRLAELGSGPGGRVEIQGLRGAEVEGRVLARLRERRGLAATRLGRAEPLGDVGRATLVTRTFEELVVDTDREVLRATARWDERAVVGTWQPGELVGQVVDTVTALHPFLRWEPVPPPVVVARHPNSPGESLLQLVIRSGVTQDPDTLEISVTSPADYVTANPGHRYRATSERHLAPPKTSQSEAELHGSFDAAIGSSDPADHTALMGALAREAGTLFDVDVPRLNDPHLRDPQPGIALEADPGTPPSTFKTLPLTLGDLPAPGQYVVHDTDALLLPYLPDPLARGISLVFQDAGRDRQLVFPFGTEGFTARYDGSWPECEPFRLVLDAAEELTGRLEDGVLTIGLPPGDTQRFRLSSSLGRDDLARFGFWQLLPDAIQALDVIAEAAADGWLWVLTPFDDVTLVHAVPRPLEAPRPTALSVARVKGSNDSGLAGALDVHGPSTEQVTAHAEWTEHTDDLALPGPDEARLNGVAFVSTIRPEEDLAILFGGVANDVQVQVPGDGPVWLHRAVHQWGDTRHREVTYRFRASTRFREYFDPTSLAPDPALPHDDGQSVVGPEVTLHVPSSARPAAPVVHSVLPLLRWDRGPEPEQPVAVRRARRAGIRIYLERPWYSSGQGELLGVLLAPVRGDAGLEDIVSQWGQDPIWRSSPVPRRALGLELDSLLRIAGLDDRPGDAAPVTRPANVRFDAVKGAPTITVLGYEPQYHAERGLWYVDVAVDPGDRFWPFVRLSVARYQPHSLAGCELSKPVRCDDVQLLPERTTSVSRTDVRHVRVVVSGPVGTRGGTKGEAFPPALGALPEAVRRHRVVVARLQRADPAIPTDLGWETVDTKELVVRGTGRTAAEAAWVGELTAPVDIPLQRPGDQPEWRVTVEETELLEADPKPLGTIAPRVLPKMRRVIYVEQIGL